nr:T9SS type A sorting domain-containing protein [uncultured Flavobacterium sp.]
MKKITFYAISAFLLSMSAQAQTIIASENFETTDEYDIPNGWFSESEDFYGFYNSYVFNYYEGCSDMNALVTNLYDADELPLLITSPNYTNLNAGEKQVSYQLRIFDYYDEIPVDYNFGTLTLSYSINNGTDWVVLGEVTNDNYTPSFNCETISYTIPAANILANSSLKFKWTSTYSGFEDYEILIDNFVLSENDETASNIDLDKTQLKIYPNPVTDLLNVEYENVISRLAIFDLLGRKVGEFTTDNKTNTVDVSYLTTGTYLLQIETENNEKSTIKFIKK